MKHYYIQREYLATLLDSNFPQRVSATYEVTETDDGLTVETMMYGTMRLIDQKEGHA